MGATVLIHGRDLEKGKKVMLEIQDVSGSDKLDLFIADLSSLDKVRRLASDIQEKHGQLHVLINNAGIYSRDRRMTEDGLEATFAVNYLAPFLLTNLLLDALKKGAPSRIINVASVAHVNATLDWDNLQGEKRFESFDAYARSKLCIILFTYALARRLKVTKVTANCLHPGVIRTKLLRAGWGASFGADVEKGARTPVYLASSPEIDGVTGKYFENMRPVRSSSISYDKTLQEELWEISEKLIGQAKY
jgi:NAD(P)-dependent dehydrogenase (short-subunit alcohol dehydrogenase family)